MTRSKYQKSKGHPWSPCASNLVQFRLIFTKLRHFEKNGTRHFSLIGRHLESVSRTIPVFKHTLAPSEKWPTQEISVRFGPFLSSYRVNIARCNLCARAKVKGHIKLKIEENTSMGKLVEHFKFGRCTSFRFMGYGRQKWQFFSTIGRHLECAIQTELVVELELALTERKQYRWFRHNSIICQEDTKGVAYVGTVPRSKVMQS